MSRNAYIAKVNKVIDHINHHLDRELSLIELSTIAHYSPFHFHRIFKSLVSENLSDFIQRVRLEKATNLLLYQPDRPITEIALQCGFSSPSAFARAFQSRFGSSATSFRKQFRNHGKVPSKIGKAKQTVTGYDEEESADSGIPVKGVGNSLKVEVKTLPSYHVAYHRHLFGYEKGVFNAHIYSSFRKVEQWLAARGLFSSETICLGITYDNPDITASDKCRYDAAFTIPVEITEASGEIGVQDVEGGLYAVCRLMGDNMEATIGRLEEAVDYLYGEWLMESSFQLADKPCLELYCGSVGQESGTFIIEYCLPLIPI